MNDEQRAQFEKVEDAWKQLKHTIERDGLQSKVLNSVLDEFFKALDELVGRKS